MPSFRLGRSSLCALAAAVVSAACVGPWCGVAIAPAAQVTCAIPAQQEQRWAVVGVPWHGPVSEFSCLTAGDALTDARIDWGDGAITAGSVTYSPALPAPSGAELQTATVSGSHTYRRPWNPAPITVTAIDGTSGASDQPDGRYTVVVVAPDHGTGVRIRARSGRVYRGPLAHVSIGVPGDAPTVVIHWGDGTQSPGALIALGDQLHSFAVDGHHRWSHSGRYAVVIRVTDSIGPQAVAIRSHATITG